MKKIDYLEILRGHMILQTEKTLNNMFKDLSTKDGDEYFYGVVDLLKLMAELDGDTFEDKVVDYLKTITLEVEDIMQRLDQFENEE